MITRRSFFSGLVAAPAVILTPGLLMPLRGLVMIPEIKTRIVRYYDTFCEDYIDVEIVTAFTFPPLIGEQTNG